MLKNLPIKKDYLLVAATVLLLLISYQFAFKRTFEAWHLNEELTGKSNQANDFTYQPDYLSRKSKNLATIVKRYSTDSINFRSNLISVVSVLADRYNVKVLESPHQRIAFAARRYVVQQLRLEGDYQSLIRLLEELSKSNHVGAVNSVLVQSLEDSRLIRKKLIMDIYMQGVIL